MDLLQLHDINELGANRILASCSLEDFLNLDGDERNAAFGALCGFERIVRLAREGNEQEARKTELPLFSLEPHLQRPRPEQGASRRQRQLKFASLSRQDRGRDERRQRSPAVTVV
jgi:hypothetical protein